MRTNSKQHYSTAAYNHASLRQCTSQKKLQSYQRGSHQHTVLSYQYSELDLLGKGYSSKVYKARHILRPEQVYAIKVIDTAKFRSSSLEMLNTQIEIQRSLNHQNIVRCFDSFKSQGYYYIITQYCPNGDLMGYLSQNRKLQEKKAIEIMKQVVSGYKYLVKTGILHRDLKPANVFKCGSTWKIGDFGFAIRERGQFKDRINVGTPLYMPLEALMKNKYSVKSDFFALAIMCYEMVCGRTPWQCSTEKELIRKMSKVNIEVPNNLKCQVLKQLIQKGGQMEESKRLTAEQFDRLICWDDNPEQILHYFQRSEQKSNRCGSPDLMKLILNGKQKKNSLSGDDLLESIQKVRNTEREKMREREQRQKTKEKPKKCELPSESTTSEEHSNPDTKVPVQSLPPTPPNNNTSCYFSPPPKARPSNKQNTTHTQSSPLNEKIVKNNNTILLSYLQLCRSLYYFIKNIHYLTLPDSHRENLKMMLFKHLLKIVKQLEDKKENYFGLEGWERYKSDETYHKIFSEFKDYSLRYDREYLEYLKSVDVNTIRTINKTFPELSQQGQKVGRQFFINVKKYLKLLLRISNHELGMKFKEATTEQEEESLRPSIEGMSSLIEYFNFIEGNLQNLEKNLPGYCAVKEMRIKVVTDYSTSKLNKKFYFDKVRKGLIRI